MTKLNIDDAVREVLAIAGGELRRNDVVLHDRLGRRRSTGPGRPSSIAAGFVELDHEWRRSHERGYGTQQGADGVLDSRRSGQRAGFGRRHRHRDLTRPSPNASSNLSSRQNPKASAWDFRSADLSSKAIAAGCGPRHGPHMAPRYVSPSRSNWHSVAATRRARVFMSGIEGRLFRRSQGVTPGPAVRLTREWHNAGDPFE